MIAGLVGVILFAVNGSGMDTNLDWNTGWVMMNVEKSWEQCLDLPVQQGK